MLRTLYMTASALVLCTAVPVLAHDGPAGSAHVSPEQILSGEATLERPDPNDALAHHDAAVLGLQGSGYVSDLEKNLEVAGRGERLLPQATTDVWVHEGFAYIGTFNSPCSEGDTEDGSGVRIFNVQNNNRPVEVNAIATPAGSRANDVKVAEMSSGDILVHSNEACAGGPGGIEIYNIDNPLGPIHLSSVRFDEVNPIADFLFGGVTDVGVHNMWLWQNGGRDYVSVVAESVFDNFRTLDITDPYNPVVVATWGAEEIFDPGVGEEFGDVGRVLAAALDLLAGFGASQNKFLHDITINKDGTRAYLSNWDAGLVLLDISNPSDPVFMSQAIDLVNGSYDMEVNSHNAWMNADGSVVVETEEDFSAWEATIPPSNLTMDGSTPGDPSIPGAALSTVAGDYFEANQTGLTGTVTGTSVEVDGGESFPAVELTPAPTQPTFADTGPISGNLVWVGRACGLTQGDVLVNPISSGDIAVVRRGACEFDEKAQTVAAAGAAAVLIANNNPVSTPWSGIRIWDYSDEVNPRLLSTFDTPCSLSLEPGGACDPRGTYSVHNVQVEGDRAYASWYTDGMVILDISDPANPIEVGRFNKSGPVFEAQNGGIQDIWGVYKVPNMPWIYGSDRNGGLYVLKEYGLGSAKVAKN